jgi:Zn finger protein HypA/HybF involved in hydrogenase expression
MKTTETVEETVTPQLTCPKCGSSEGRFSVAVETYAKLCNDEDWGPGVDEIDGDVSWEDESSCWCCDCDHEATVAEFEGKPKPAPKPSESDLVTGLKELELRTRQFIKGELVTFPAALLPQIQALIAAAGHKPL